MPKLMKKRSRKAGLPPGTLIHIGEKKTEEIKITIMDYDESQFQEKEAKSYDDRNNEIITEQISLIMGRNFVLSFQENIGDVFDQIRERIRSGKGKIRKMGADYLVYTLLDAIVDNYFIILEKIGEQIEFIEERLISNPASETLNTIHKLKREMLFLRKSVWPLSEE